MPLYRFVVHAIDGIDDPEGVQTLDQAARAEAVKIIRELKNDSPHEELQNWALAITEDHREGRLHPLRYRRLRTVCEQANNAWRSTLRCSAGEPRWKARPMSWDGLYGGSFL
jgi:hypothetical protein